MQEMMNPGPGTGEQDIKECTRPIDLIDPDNPESLAQLGGRFKAAFEKAWKYNQELFHLNEKELHTELRNQGKQPKSYDNMLRLNFWSEYEKSFQESRPMVLANVAGGICRVDIIYKYIQSPQKLVWMMCPPASYQSKMVEALSYGTDKMREILELSLDAFDQKGNPKVDVALAALQTKIWAMLDLRVKGSVIQKHQIEQKSLSINVTDKFVKGMTAEMQIKEVDKKIRELEKKEAKLLGAGDNERSDDIETEATEVEVTPGEDRPEVESPAHISV